MKASGLFTQPHKFFRAAFSTILRSKIVENAALKKYYPFYQPHIFTLSRIVLQNDL